MPQPVLCSGPLKAPLFPLHWGFSPIGCHLAFRNELSSAFHNVHALSPTVLESLLHPSLYTTVWNVRAGRDIADHECQPLTADEKTEAQKATRLLQDSWEWTYVPSLRFFFFFYRGPF